MISVHPGSRVSMPSRSKTAGFTLIELMIVVVVVAILSALAYPTYQTAVRKSRRTPAKTALLDLASREERYFSANNIYSSEPLALGYSSSNPISVPDASTNYYGMTVTVSSDPATGVSRYQVIAVPQGDQARDPCASYLLNSTGVRSSLGASTSSTDCWK